MSLLRLQVYHIDRLAELEQLCFAVPWTRAMLVSELKNPLACYYVLEEAGQVLGYGGMQVVLDEGYITNIACDPAQRRKGVGRRILTALVDEAKRRELSFLTLEVRRSNLPAQGLYASFGFEQTGVRPRYYEKPTEDALLMTLWLKPPENLT